MVTRRLAELLSDRELRWRKAVELAALFDPEDLASAGVPDHVVELVRMRRRVDATGSGATLSVPSGHGEAAEDDDGEEEEEPPRLGELLDGGGETDVLILNNTHYFAPQVADLSEWQMDELRARLARWWPQGSYLETITRTSPNSWTQEAGAHAWICFGPEAKPALDPEGWAQLATCGILFETQTNWLREAQTLEGIHRAVELLDDDGNLERWEQLFSCCVDPLPDRALLACARSLDPSLPKGSDTTGYQLRTIAGRMIDNDRADLAKDLAGRHPDFVADLAVILAERGDPDAQCQLLPALVEQLSEGEMPDEGCLKWLSGIRAPKFLDDLFDVVRHTYRPQRDRGTRIRGFDRSDIARAAMETIAAVGGRGAVDGYDRLIAAGDDFRWLRYQRSQVAGAALVAEGKRFAAVAAGRLELPLLDAAHEPAQD